MNEDRLNELLSIFHTRRIAVVGDYFLDKYLVTDPILAETSIETGKTAHQVVGIRHSPGAAGTVVSNLVSLGAGEVIPIGFTGDDGEGHDLRQGLRKLGCDTGYLLCTPELQTPTYLKPCDLSTPGLDGEFERYDTKNRRSLPADIMEAMGDILESVVPSVDAVIVADQVEEDDCGVVTADMRDTVADLASKYPHIVFWADSRQRINCFKRVIVKPNEFEVVRSVFPEISGTPDEETIVAAGHRLAQQTERPVFVTRSARGMLVYDRGECRQVRGVRVDEPTDPTGAGDSATAGAVMALTSGATPEEAALVANLVASITVQCLGTTGTANPRDLPERLALWHSQGM